MEKINLARWSSGNARIEVKNGKSVHMEKEELRY
jgi:hypothetical protein